MRSDYARPSALRGDLAFTDLPDDMLELIGEKYATYVTGVKQRTAQRSAAKAAKDHAMKTLEFVSRADQRWFIEWEEGNGQPSGVELFTIFEKIAELGPNFELDPHVHIYRTQFALA